MIHDATVVKGGRKDRTELEIKKTYTVFQYNKFMKDKTQGEQVAQLLLSSEENSQMAGGIC